MATHPDLSLEEEEQAFHIRRLRLESEKLEAESRKLMAEASKLNAEQFKLSAERQKLTRDTTLSPWLFVVQATLAAAAIMGAGAALAKLFLIR